MNYKVLFLPLSRVNYYFPHFLPRSHFSFPHDFDHCVFKTMMKMNENSLLTDYFFPVGDSLLKRFFLSGEKSILSKSHLFGTEPFHFSYNQGNVTMITCKGIYSGVNLEKQVDFPFEVKFNHDYLIKCGITQNNQTILFYNENNIYLYHLNKREFSQIPIPYEVTNIEICPYGFLISLHGQFISENYLSKGVNEPLFLIKDNQLLNIGYFDSYKYDYHIEWSFYARQPTTKNQFLRRKIDTGSTASFKYSSFLQMDNSLLIKMMGKFVDCHNHDYHFSTYIIIPDCDGNILSLNTIQKQWDFFMDTWNTNGVILLQQKLKNSWHKNGELHHHQKHLMYFEF